MAQEDALKDCQLEGWESGHIGTDTCMAYLQTMFGKSGVNWLKNNALRKGMPTLALHSYWASPEERQAFADAIATTYGSNYKLALTEYCQMTEDQNSGVYDLIQKNGMDSGLGMEYGLALAGIIHQDLTVLNVVEWDWWTACAFGGYTDGLVYLDKNSHQVETSKRLWVLGNFSKFTDEGSVRISITLPEELSDVQSVAFKNPNGTVTAVFINNTDKARQHHPGAGRLHPPHHLCDRQGQRLGQRQTAAPPPMPLPSLPAPSPPWCWKSKSESKRSLASSARLLFCAYAWKSGRQIAAPTKALL